MEDIRQAAVNNLRYSGSGQLAGCAVPGQLQPRELTAIERAEIEAQQRTWQRNYNRQQALGHTLALGRRYDSAQDAIADATTIANWIGLEIE